MGRRWWLCLVIWIAIEKIRIIRSCVPSLPPCSASRPRSHRLDFPFAVGVPAAAFGALSIPHGSLDRRRRLHHLRPHGPPDGVAPRAVLDLLVGAPGQHAELHEGGQPLKRRGGTAMRIGMVATRPSETTPRNSRHSWGVRDGSRTSLELGG